MFKVFNRCLTTRTSRHDQTKINILQLFHVVINRTNVDYAALLWIDEDYHSIKDDIPLVSVYTTRNVTIRGMLIPDALLTKEIHATDDYKEYETVFVNVDVPMNQPGRRGSKVLENQVHHKKLLKINVRQKQVSKGEKDEQSYDDVDDSDNRLEPESHKENPKHADDDDDDKEEEKVDEKEGDEMGSLETRTEEMQTPILTTPRSPRKILSSDKNIDQELTDTILISTSTTRIHTLKDIFLASTIIFRERFTHKKVDQVLHEIIPQLAERATYDLIENNLKPYAWEKETVIDEDEVIPKDETPELIIEFQNVDKRVPTIFDHARMEATLNDMLSNQFKNAEEYAYHLEQATNFMENQIVWESRQEDIRRPVPKPLEKKYILSLYKIHTKQFPKADLEEKMNRWVRKEFKNFNEDARLSIQHWKDSWHKRVYKQNQIRVRDNPEDYFSNHRITKVIRITTDQQHGLDFMEEIIVMRENDNSDSFSEAEFKYLNKNDFEDLYYLFQNKKVNYRETKLMNSLITFIISYVIWERVHDFRLRIESYQIKVNLTAPTLTFPGIKEYEPYSIVDKPTTGLIYLNSKDEKRVMYLVEIVKFCDVTLEKVLKEVKLKVFQSEPWKKSPPLGELDHDIMRAFEREITKRLRHQEQMRRWESFVNGRLILPTMKRL
ncbi:hypothetical protein Tco_0073426 [Tanacetum coccineum]